jgi:plastocyanin
MKCTLFLAASCLLALPAFAETKSITMKSISFDPKVLELIEGDSVEWVNKSYTDHSATSENGAFDTGLIAPSKTTKAVVFPKAGHFAYHCSMHGKSMSGILEVKAKSK